MLLFRVGVLVLAGVALGIVSVAGCDTSPAPITHASSMSGTSSTRSSAATSATALATTAHRVDIAGHDRSACTIITDDGDLHAAKRLFVAGPDAKAGDVYAVIIDVSSALAAAASPELSASISDVLTILEQLNSRLMNRDISPANPTAAKLDAADRPIVSFCRSHHYPVPATT